MRRFIVCAVAGALLCAVGCARRPNTALEHARAALQQANQNPDITTNAPVALHDAQLEFDRGQRAFDDNKSDDAVENHAYITERKLDIARANATQKMSDAEVARLNEQRGDVLLQSRTGEANAARADAAEARRELQQLQQQVSSMHPRQTNRGVMLTLSNVLFEFDRAELKPGAENDLAKVAAFLRDHPDRNVAIEGHTDSIGSADYNDRLSRERAAAVRDYLVRNGVSPDQVTATGYGKEYPVATNSTEAGRQQNRRVDIVIANPSEATAGVGRRSIPPPSTTGPGIGATGDTDPAVGVPGGTNPGSGLGTPGDIQRTDPKATDDDDED